MCTTKKELNTFQGNTAKKKSCSTSLPLHTLFTTYGQNKAPGSEFSHTPSPSTSSLKKNKKTKTPTSQ